MKIGVFDSGVGGKSVADALSNALADHEVIFINDSENMPYGDKTDEELERLVTPKIQLLIDKGCQIIVVACNTVSCTIFPKIRSKFTVEIVGIVPMVKPACNLTKSGKIAVCATPRTLSSLRYAELKNEFASKVEVFEPAFVCIGRQIEIAVAVDRQIGKAVGQFCHPLGCGRCPIQARTVTQGGQQLWSSGRYSPRSRVANQSRRVRSGGLIVRRGRLSPQQPSEEIKQPHIASLRRREKETAWLVGRVTDPVANL